jgi:hypothetical protein
MSSWCAGICHFNKNNFGQVNEKNNRFFVNSQILAMYDSWTASTLKSAFLFALSSVGEACVDLIQP